MPRKRNGFIPLGDVAEAVELPGCHALEHQGFRHKTGACLIVKAFVELVHFLAKNLC